MSPVWPATGTGGGRWWRRRGVEAPAPKRHPGHRTDRPPPAANCVSRSTWPAGPSNLCSSRVAASGDAEPLRALRYGPDQNSYDCRSINMGGNNEPARVPTATPHLARADPAYGQLFNVSLWQLQHGRWGWWRRRRVATQLQNGIRPPH